MVVKPIRQRRVDDVGTDGVRFGMCHERVDQSRDGIIVDVDLYLTSAKKR